MADQRAPTWVRCPACHTMSGLLNLGLSARENTYECEECGHVWTATATATRTPETGRRTVLRRRSQ